MKRSKIIIIKTRLGFQDKDSNSEILDDQALIDEIIDADDSKSNDDDIHFSLTTLQLMILL